MSNPRQYEKVTGGSDNKRWEPNKSTAAIDPKNPPMIEGYYTAVNEIPGPNGIFKVHSVKTLQPDGSLGEEFDVSLGAVIDDVLGKIKIGSWICIQYKGKKPSKIPGRSYNDIDVFVDNNAIPYTEMLGSKSGATTTGSNSAPVKNETAQNNAPAAQNANAFPEDDDMLPF